MTARQPDAPHEIPRRTLRWISAGLLLLVFASIVMGRSFTAICPGPYDASLFMYIGDRWLQGAVPYVDIWDNKPPGIYAISAATFSLFPKSTLALAIVEGCFITGAIFAVYRLMRRISAPSHATLTATIGAAIACNLSFYNQGGVLTEIYLLLPAATAMLLFVRGVPTMAMKWFLLSGMCTGVATMFKMVGLAPILAQVAFLFLLVLRRTVTTRRALMALASLSVGLVLSWAPVLVYFGKHGALGAMLNATLLFNLRYASGNQSSIPEMVKLVTPRLWPLAGSAVVAMVALVSLVRHLFPIRRAPTGTAGAWKGSPVPWLPLVALWVLADSAGALAGGRAYPHYFLPLTISLPLAAGMACWWLTEREGATRGPVLKVCLSALVLLPLLFCQVGDISLLRRAIRKGPAQSVVLDELARRSEPDDTLFVWHYEPYVYFRSGLRSTSRYLCASVYLTCVDSARDEIAAEILASLEEGRPTWIVDSPPLAHTDEAWDPVHLRFQELLATRYRLLLDQGGQRLYRYAAD